MVLAEPATQSFGLEATERFAALALECLHQEYPNKIAHVLQADRDAQPPRQLTPAFFGCYDWHSAVHGHWLLARLARLYPQSELAGAAREALARSLTPGNIAGEVRYLEGEGRAGFERPYGLAWLLTLALELREWDDDQARSFSAALEPLEAMAVSRLVQWMPKLTHAIRGGEHSQTAFAFGLIIDWARRSKRFEVSRQVEERVESLYLEDRQCPLAYEPSGHDFLSPCLAEADLVRRVLWRHEFAAWLGAFLPQIPLHRPDDKNPAAGPVHENWLTPARVSDRSDGKLGHLDGLNLSRSWMLEGIASGLPAKDPRIPALLDAARIHRHAGVAAVTGEHYAGGHWLGSFATYLVTARGGSRVMSQGRVDIAYRGVERELVEQIVLPRALRALAAVEAELGIEYPGRLRIDLDPGHRVPAQAGDQIFLPASRLEDQNSSLSIMHEVVHVLAPSAYRPDRFYDDGLAVHLQAKLGEVASYPQFDQELHQATKSLAAELGGFLPLAESEKARRRPRSEKERRLAYLQEGSFCRFLIESRGLELFLRVYRGASPDEVYGLTFEALEAEWLQMLDAHEESPKTRDH
ncbi:MAG: DUF2891 domain-containing protein [Acidobacteriota bacterium]